MAKSKTEKKNKTERKPREVVEIEVGFDRDGYPETRDKSGALIVGIPKSAFMENAPEKVINKETGKEVFPPGAKSWRFEAKNRAFQYQIDVLTWRKGQLGAKADPKKKASTQLEKLYAKEAALLATINGTSADVELDKILREKGLRK